MSTTEGSSSVSYITDEMRGAVGGELTRRVSYPVSSSDIRRWALATYFPEQPPARFIEAQVAPEEFNAFAWIAAERDERVDGDAHHLDPDLTELLAGITPPGLRHQLNGGLEVEYGVPMRAGDVITSVMRLVDYREREGRLGLMLFSVTEDVWNNQDDEMVKRTRMTLIRY